MRNRKILFSAFIFISALITISLVWVLSSDRLKQSEDKPTDGDNVPIQTIPDKKESDDNDANKTEDKTTEKPDENIDKPDNNEKDAVEPDESENKYKGTSKINGIVMFEDQKSAANSKIQLLDFAGEISKDAKIVEEIAADADGKFEFTEIISGKYKIAAFAENFGFATSSLIQLGEDDEKYVEKTIMAGFRLFGNIHDSEKKNLESEEIHCVLLEAAGDSWQGLAAATGKSDDAGNYEIKGLKSGQYWIQVTLEGYATYRGMVVISEDTQKDFELTIGGAIHGFVKDEEGNPVTKFKASCFLDSDELNQNAVDKIAAQFKSFENELGEFMFYNLSENKYAIEIVSDAYAQTIEEQIQVEKGKTTEVEIIVASGITLAGIVLEQETDKPIANAKVSIADTIKIKSGDQSFDFPYIESKELTTVTDSEGKFTISGLPKKTVHVWISHEDYPQVKTSVNFVGEIKSEYKFYMVGSSSTVFGKVYDENETPVEGRTVLIQLTGTQVRKTAKTDKNGEYRIEKIAPGSYLIILLSEANSVEELASFSINMGEQLEINFGIEKGITVSGTVSKNGEPIKTRNVTFTYQDSSTALKITATSDEGKYKVILSKPGKYTVLIQGYDMKFGALTSRFEIEVPDVTEHVEDFEILENSVTGMVLSEADNKPMHRSAVIIESMSSSNSQNSVHDIARTYCGNTATNEAGEFKLVEVSAGKYRITISAEGFATKIIENVVISGNGTKNDLGRIFLKQETKITGFVTDDSAAPVPYATFTITDSKGQKVSSLIPIRGGKDGKYTISRLSEGTYTISVHANGYAKKTLSPVKIGQETEMNLDIILSKGASLTVFVKDTENKMLKNVSVKLYGSSGYVKPIFKGLQEFTPPGITDITGKNVRGSLSAGLYTVVVSTDGYKSQTKKIYLTAGLNNELEFILYRK
ncbi:MAG: carboxypeptidase regulatory-like domain-containing protein [Planctomycetes bacterium]|nr:carboxypeptidase regulatory-like domain-containing protein [Planctomycetota bacterium]